MEMEVVLPLPPAGDFFNFAAPSSSHYFTAPSTPLPPFAAAASVSAPTSPSHVASNFFCDLDLDIPISSPSTVPFRWEERPGIPKSPKCSGEDFEFDFSGQSANKASLSADELFDGGKIKPLKPPPGFQQSSLSSPRSPKLSPRNKNDIDEDPFEAALIKETRSHSSNYELYDDPQNRGRRDNKISYISSNFARKATRSLSPFRISSQTAAFDGAAADAVKPKSSAISFPKANRSKWRLRDFLFRSASEGRATEKTNYVVMSKKVDDDVKNSSFRSADGGGGSIFHFMTPNRAVSEELKKKSFLPHRPGFLGRCLRFNRSGVQEMSRGIGSLTRG